MLPKLELLPESSSYTMRPGNTVVSTQLEGGMSRSRVDLVNAAKLIDCHWVLDRSEYMYLSVFFESIIARGAKPFLIDLIIDKPYSEERTAKIVPGSFEMSAPVGMSFSCRASLEIAPKDDHSFEEALALLWPEMENHFLMVDLEKFANYTLDVSG